MSTYILRPKLKPEQRVSSAVAMVSVGFRPELRTKQVHEVLSLRAKDPVLKEIEEWLKSKKKKSRDQSKGAMSSRITGTSVVDLSDDEAENLRRDLPNVSVIPDRLLDLIQPNRAGAANAKRELTQAQRWHLSSVGVARRGKRICSMTGKGVCVAVFDTGIDQSHPELVGRVAKSYRFDTEKWKAVVDDSRKDTEQHGTHVAGLIAGKTIGVAPQATLIDGKMIPGGRGHLSDFLLALEWAAAQPEIQIVNISAGIPGYVPEMRDVIDDLIAVGILPIMAIGNEGKNRTRSPANCVGGLSVGACDEDDDVPGFSGSGRMVVDNQLYEVPDVVAPGVQVYSCVPGGTYEPWDGTSMAAPVVSGIAALMIQAKPDITVTQLIDDMLCEATYNEDEDDMRQGYGVVQAP